VHVFSRNFPSNEFFDRSRFASQFLSVYVSLSRRSAFGTVRQVVQFRRTPLHSNVWRVHAKNADLLRLWMLPSWGGPEETTGVEESAGGYSLLTLHLSIP
jgi:hypothetical protein